MKKFCKTYFKLDERFPFLKTCSSVNMEEANRPLLHSEKRLTFYVNRYNEWFNEGSLWSTSEQVICRLEQGLRCELPNIHYEGESQN